MESAGAALFPASLVNIIYAREESIGVIAPHGAAETFQSDILTARLTLSAFGEPVVHCPPCV